jgi:hypothetical protein
VQGFLDAHAVEVGPINKSDERRTLDAAVAALNAAGAAQKFAKKRSESLTRVKNEQRKSLLDHHVRPIVAIAQKVTSTGATLTPDIQKIRMPKRRTPDLILAATTRAMAAGAARYTETYVAQQMPRGFARQARRAADDLQAVLNERSASILNRARATGDAAQQTSIIRESIRVLHAMVHARFHRLHRDDLAAAWNQVKRYPHKPGVKRPRKESP